MKSWLCLLASAVPLVSAQTETATSSFAADWRVTGFMRHGQYEEASIERAGLRPRFVREGDRLPGDIIVLEVNYAERTVTIFNGKENAVIRPEEIMAAPPNMAKNSKPGMVATSGGPLVALKQEKQDKRPQMPASNGAWTMTFSNGRSMDMQSYAQRFGGIGGAFKHVQERLQTETDPERIAYRKEQLKILKQMSKAGVR